METVDDETTAAADRLHAAAGQANRPFFCWLNTTRMHASPMCGQSMCGQSGMPSNICRRHDRARWRCRQAAESARRARHRQQHHRGLLHRQRPAHESWPDGGTTPFRSEKNTNWEGAFRVPAMIRWPGRIKAGEVSNEMISGLDWFPTLLAAAGDADIKDRLLTGTNLGGKTFKVHLDGYNQLPYLTGQRRNPHATSSTTSTTTASSWRFATRTGSWCSASSARPGTFEIWRDAVHLPACAEDVQPAHGPIRAGRYHVEHVLRLDVPRCRSWSSRLRRWWRSSSRRSRSSRRGKRHPASASTKFWRRWKRAPADHGKRDAPVGGASRRGDRYLDKPFGFQMHYQAPGVQPSIAPSTA